MIIKCRPSVNRCCNWFKIFCRKSIPLLPISKFYHSHHITLGIQLSWILGIERTKRNFILHSVVLLSVVMSGFYFWNCFSRGEKSNYVMLWISRFGIKEER